MNRIERASKDHYLTMIEGCKLAKSHLIEELKDAKLETPQNTSKVQGIEKLIGKNEKNLGYWMNKI